MYDNLNDYFQEKTLQLEEDPPSFMQSTQPMEESNLFQPPFTSYSIAPLQSPVYLPQTAWQQPPILSTVQSPNPQTLMQDTLWTHQQQQWSKSIQSITIGGCSFVCFQFQGQDYISNSCLKNVLGQKVVKSKIDKWKPPSAITFDSGTNEKDADLYNLVYENKCINDRTKKGRMLLVSKVNEVFGQSIALMKGSKITDMNQKRSLGESCNGSDTQFPNKKLRVERLEMDLEKEPKLISSQSTVTSSDETPDIQPSEPETSSIACPKKSIVIDHGGYQITNEMDGDGVNHVDSGLIQLIGPGASLSQLGSNFDTFLTSFYSATRNNDLVSPRILNKFKSQAQGVNLVTNKPIIQIINQGKSCNK